MNTNRKRMYFTVTLICILLVLPIRLILGKILSGSCTTFTVAQADKVLFGNNEDFSNSDGRIGFYPPSSEGYGYVALGRYDEISANVNFEGGINDQGLAWDVLSLPATKLTPHPERLYSLWDDNFFHKLFREISTVKQAIELAENTDFGESLAMQIFIADSSGNAVVISPGPEGELAFTTKESGDGYLASVNINQSMPNKLLTFLHGGRLDTTQEMLGDMNTGAKLTPANAGSILEAVRLGRIVDAATGSFTAYSNVFDLRNDVVYLYYLSQFDNVVEINLEEELAKGQRILKMGDLFPEEVTEIAIAEYEAIHTQGRILVLFASALLLTALGLLVILVYKVIKKLRRSNTLAQ